MSNEGSPKKHLPPYVAYRTLTNFIDSLKQGLPQQIDRSVMSSKSGGSQSHIMAALEYLHLTDNGVTTELLRKLVDSDRAQQKEIWKELIADRYSFLSEGGCDLTCATEKQVQDCFMKTGASSSTMHRSYSFFVTAAKEAGLQLSPYILKSAKGQRSTSSRPRRKSPPVTSQNGQEVEQRKEFPPPPADHSQDSKPEFSTEDRFLLDKLISKLPEFDPKWDPEIKAEWLKAFRELRSDLKTTGEK
jgi:hypothetical protein